MKVMGSVSFKLIILFLILSGTLSYSVYLKKTYSKLEDQALKPVLKNIPDIEIVDNLTEKKFNLKKESSKSNSGTFVHFWGTWCGPCEEELPSFIELSKKFQKSGDIFFLVAVNDNKKDLKKFFKRFKSLPKNIKILLDNSGVLMNSFGVVKVPETFVFDKNGRSLKKFSGPQDWSYSYYLKTINNLFRET